jgi:hypothetical protein
MSWTFKFFKTAAVSAAIVGPTFYDVTDVIGDFTVNEELGDEFYVSSGDLTIEMGSDVYTNYDSAFHNWLGLYWDSTLYNVYHVGYAGLLPGPDAYDLRYTEKDEKRNIYKTTLPSIQNYFFQHLNNSVLSYTTDSNKFQYNLSSTKITIEKIRELKTPEQYLADRWGFSLYYLLTNLIDKTNNSGLKIDGSPTLPSIINVPPANNIPILFRGVSYDISAASEATAVNGTFGTPGTTWGEIFRLACYAYNCFLHLKPATVTTHLNVNLALIPKFSAASVTPVSVTWIERTYAKHKHKIDGVRITGLDFEYTQDIYDSNNIFEKGISIYDISKRGNSIDLEQTNEYLFMADGDYVQANLVYDILDGSNYNKNWWVSGNLDTNYSDVVSDGHAYSGEILFTGEKTGDQIVIGSNRMQISAIDINRRGKTKIEGPQI